MAFSSSFCSLFILILLLQIWLAHFAVLMVIFDLRLNLSLLSSLLFQTKQSFAHNCVCLQEFIEFSMCQLDNQELQSFQAFEFAKFDSWEVQLFFGDQRRNFELFIYQSFVPYKTMSLNSDLSYFSAIKSQNWQQHYLKWLVELHHQALLAQVSLLPFRFIIAFFHFPWLIAIFFK